MDKLAIAKVLYEDFGISINKACSLVGLIPNNANLRKIRKLEKPNVSADELAILLQGKSCKLAETRLWQLILDRLDIKNKEEAKKVIKRFYSEQEWKARKKALFNQFIRHLKEKHYKNFWQFEEFRKKVRHQKKPGKGYKISWDELFIIAKQGGQKRGRAIVGDGIIRERLEKLGLTKREMAEISYEEYKKKVAEYEIRKYLKENWLDVLYEVWFKCEYYGTEAEGLFREFMLSKTDIVGKSYEEFLNFVFERVYLMKNYGLKKGRLYEMGFRTGRNGGRYSCRGVFSPSELLEMLEKTTAWHVLALMNKELYVKFRSRLVQKGYLIKNVPYNVLHGLMKEFLLSNIYINIPQSALQVHKKASPEIARSPLCFFLPILSEGLK